jgi:guanylate cyclase
MFNKNISQFFKWLTGYNARDDTTTRLSKIIGTMCTFMGVFFSLILGFPLLFHGGSSLVAWSYIGFAAWSLTAHFLYLSNKIGRILLVYLNLVPLTFLTFLMSVLLGGVENSGAIIIWALAPPLLSPIILTPRHTFYWGATYMALLVVSLFAQDMFTQTISLPPDTAKWLFLCNIGGISIFTMVVVYVFVIQRDMYQKRSESLLLNILPREIADILQVENRVIADAFEDVTVLFADVVNFTPMSSRLSPVELVKLLNAVFSHFDSLVDKHKLEKIKTIGDCYMVASGIPGARADHAQAITRMALEFLSYARINDFNGHKLEFRIGINSGPVVAGVIGHKKFAYDLWGDVVNVASRMESQGESNVIQITRDTYELIKDDFICEPKKAINIKGKGEMEIWHVVREKG